MLNRYLWIHVTQHVLKKTLEEPTAIYIFIFMLDDAAHI
jgi:hypothetical protein